MSDPRTLRRISPGRNRPGAWKRLPLVVDDEPPPTTQRVAHDARSIRAERSSPTTGPQAPPPVFHPLAYRGVVAGWPLESRELWGRRANELEDAGLSWRDAETQAFVEIWRSLRTNA